MKKILLLAFIFSIPSITNAAWWDFSTWFSSTRNGPATIETTSTPPIIIREVIKEVPVEKNVEEVVEKPVEKIVTKTITNTVTVDNPALIKQIEALKIERDNWKLSFENISKDKDILNKKITSLNEDIVRYQKEIGEWNSKYTLLNNKFQEISLNPIDMEVLKIKMIEAQKQIDLDRGVQELIKNIEDPSRICIGRIPGVRGGEDTRADVKQNRALDPVLDQACKKLGY